MVSTKLGPSGFTLSPEEASGMEVAMIQRQMEGEWGGAGLGGNFSGIAYFI